MRFLIAPAIVLALSLIGFALLPFRRDRARLVVPLSLSFGALVVGWLVFVIGTLAGTTAAMIAAALLLAASLRKAPAWWTAVRRCGRDVALLCRHPAALLAGALALLVVPQLLLPLVDSDGVRYHAALPKLFLLQGHVSYYPWDVAGAYPQTAEMLYMIGIAAQGGEVAKVLHFLFFLATLFTIALIVHRGRSTRVAALLAPFLYAAAPVSLGPAGSAFIDHIVVFHIAVALQLLLARRGAERVALPLAAAFATKLTALPAIGLLFVAAAFTSRRRVRSFAVMAAIVAVAFLPFAVRSVWYTGDPIYPIGLGLLGLPIEGVSKESVEYATQFHSEVGGVAGIPWYPQEGVQDDEVVGIHHLLGLFALPLALRERRLRVPLLVVIAFLGVAVVYAVPSRHYLSMLLMLSMFEALALARLRRWAPVAAVVAALPALFVSVPIALTFGAPFHWHEMERSAYLARILPAYRAMEIVNRAGGPGTVMALDLPAPYYFDRPWIAEGLLNEPPLKRWVAEATSVEQLHARLREHRVRFLLVTPGYGGGGPHTLVALASNRREAQLLDAFRRTLRPVARVDSVDVFEVR